MDLYTVIATWTGWPAVVALMLLAGGFAYWMLNKRNELLKEKNEWLTTKLEASKESSPDVLAKALADRYRLTSEELERLRLDHATSQDLIQTKEAELATIRIEIESLTNQLEEAQETIAVVAYSQLLCPSCGSPLATRESHPAIGYDDRDDFEHEYARYECGYSTVDGRILEICTRSSQKAK